MAATYEPIATTTAGAAVTFSSIPSTYTDLILIVRNASGSGGINNTIRVNGDTTSNYSSTQLYASSGAAGSLRTSSASTSWGGIGGADSISIIQFMNYSNTTTYKTWISRGSGTGNYITMDVDLWRSTAAINSIYIDSGAAAGSSFTLYGIKAA